MSSSYSRWLVLCVILTAPLLYVIDIFIINMAIPVIKLKLHASQSDVQLVIAGYLLGSACFLIPAARAGDFLGRKKVFFRGMLFFTLTSCLCGLSASPWQLNIARFFQGASSALMVTQSLSLIQELFPQVQERARAIGWYGITLSIAAIIGQILGGYLAEVEWIVAGWRLIFFINVPVGLASLWAIRRYVTETPRQDPTKFDLPGAGFLALALGGLIYALTAGREAGWPLWSILLAGAGAGLLVIFFWYQKRQVIRSETPLMDVRIFRQPGFVVGLTAVLFHFMLHTAYLLMIAVYLQSGKGISALRCGVYFLPHALLFMLSSYMASKLLVKFGKRILLLGLALIMVSFVLHILLLDRSAGTFTIVALIGLYGFGNGTVLPFLLNIVLDNVPTGDAGIASGIFSTFQQIASALGIGLIGGVFYNSLHGDSSEAYQHALQNGLLAGMGCLVVVAVMLGRVGHAAGREPGTGRVDVHG